MKTCLVVAILLVVFVATMYCDTGSTVHNVRKRQIVKPVTIHVKPPPGCVFYECIANCKQRGYKNGGYCTINGCQCLR
ncbi:gallerimycin-like [Nymphalis io]|uniref:gallerimycin-like n=1 Tax=Inachis io TaxID=171585 RepID=UPI002168595A|nr:gallerimycin-like [Nymphalis io]